MAGGLQSLLAAVAFSGAGILFRHLEPNAYAEESKRHNRGLEQLAKKKEVWYEHTVEK